MAGGRVVGCNGWDDPLLASIDSPTLCLPLLADPRAIADVAGILAPRPLPDSRWDRAISP
ncbi:hypothetical protein SAMN04489732_109269 [Amycolatopsis saalfeldensis]|uniref:Uncharacterized protein n=1 Tax=Amycolatopsis saalfeldensis TaxID=394193 RepID=A0A1H8XXL8_9PSEU|nr:hypothetical protein SAMN04489732_109269 [Amycolatopsis saalfeldensis]